MDFALPGIDGAEYAVLDAIWPGPMSTQPTADGSRQGVTDGAYHRFIGRWLGSKAPGKEQK